MRYIELYDRYTDVHEEVRIMCGLHSIGSHDEATGLCDAMLGRYDKEIGELVRC